MQSCNICLENLVDQVIGAPDKCNHEFCFNCLTEWNKTSNTCPNDRETFTFIFKKHSIASRRPYAKVDRRNPEVEIALEDYIVCNVCSEEDRDDRPLLTCNECRKSYHKICLKSLDVAKLRLPLCECITNDRPQLKHLERSLMAMLDRTRTGKSFSHDQVKTGRITKSRLYLQYPTLQDAFKKVYHSSSKTTCEFLGRNANIRPMITPREAARRIAASGLPVSPSPQLTAQKTQKKCMKDLRLQRVLVARLPSKISTEELPRIPRRTDAPVRPQLATVAQNSSPPTKASFIDKLLHSQNQLYSSKNIQIQGANIKLS